MRLPGGAHFLCSKGWVWLKARRQAQALYAKCDFGMWVIRQAKSASPDATM